MEKMYSVKTARNGRYIVWCDEHWYETMPAPNPVYTKEEAEAIVKQLKNHYVYTAFLVDEDGNELTAHSENPMKTEKKSIGKLSITRKMFSKINL